MNAMTGTTTTGRTCRLAVFAVVFLGLSLSDVASAQQPEDAPKQADQEIDRPNDATTPPRGRPGFGGPPREGYGERGDSGRRGQLARRWRAPSEEDVERFLVVAGEFDAHWRDDLIKMRNEDQDRFRQVIVTYGRRFWQLVELREKNPELYHLRLEELKNNRILNQLGREYHSAIEQDDTETAERIKLEIIVVARVQVEIEIRVRGEELAAMAAALKRMRESLIAEAETTEDRVQRLAGSILNPPAVGEGHPERPGLPRGRRDSVRTDDGE